MDLQMDASGAAWGAQFAKAHGGQIRPLGWYSETFSAADVKWDIRARELSVIKQAIVKGRTFCGGKVHGVTDHRTLADFARMKVDANHRLARWAEFLAGCDNS